MMERYHGKACACYAVAMAKAKKPLTAARSTRRPTSSGQAARRRTQPYAKGYEQHHPREKPTGRALVRDETWGRHAVLAEQVAAVLGM